MIYILIMEINYNLIVKYLANNKKDEVLFSSNKNMMTTSEKFPSEFKGLLGDKFYRIGVTQTQNENNISFYTSLLTLLDENFMTLTNNEEKYKLLAFIDSLTNLTNLPDNLKEISKGALKKYIKEMDTNIWILEWIANKLKINFLIFDFKSLNIYTIYQGLVMNPWKPILLLAKNDKNWEPMRNSEKKTFSYLDNFVKKIFNYGVTYYDEGIIKKEFTLVDNLHEIIQEFNEDKIIEDDKTIEEEDNTEELTENKVNDSTKNKVNDSTFNTFIKSDNKMISESKLNKMTKDDLIIYMKSLNLKPNTKSTKKDLIKTVLSQN